MGVLPAGWDGVTPYGERGWCTFEKAVSQLIKGSVSRGWRKLADTTVRRRVSGYAGAYITAPEPPEAFAARLALKTFTNGKADCELVAALYADTLAAALGAASYLQYTTCRWGDDEVVHVAAVLPFARRLIQLDLAGNPRIGRRGLDALAGAIADRAAPSLKRVVCDQAGSEHAAGLRAACAARGIVVSTVDEYGA